MQVSLLGACNCTPTTIFGIHKKMSKRRTSQIAAFFAVLQSAATKKDPGAKASCKKNKDANTLPK
jgi:hypothetical protein